jgi:hypothetical protein
LIIGARLVGLFQIPSKCAGWQTSAGVLGKIPWHPPENFEFPISTPVKAPTSSDRWGSQPSFLLSKEELANQPRRRFERMYDEPENGRAGQRVSLLFNQLSSELLVQHWPWLARLKIRKSKE